MTRLQRRLLRTAQWAFIGIGVGAWGYWVKVSLGATLYQAQHKRDFSLARGFSREPCPIKQYPVEGAGIGLLEIPRLHLSVVVVEGVGSHDLSLGLGHIPGTALPGDPGNVGVAGHRDTFFRPLRFIRKNDLITLATPRGSYAYQVDSTRIVLPENTEVLKPGRDSLTLVTCYPFAFIGSAPKRFIVTAHAVK